MKGGRSAPGTGAHKAIPGQLSERLDRVAHEGIRRLRSRGALGRWLPPWLMAGGDATERAACEVLRTGLDRPEDDLLCWRALVGLMASRRDGGASERAQRAGEALLAGMAARERCAGDHMLALIREGVEQNAPFAVGLCARLDPDLGGWEAGLGALARTCIERGSAADPHTLRLLIGMGAQTTGLDAFDRSALHLACACGHESIVRCLLGLGLAVNAVDAAGETPLHEAVRRGARCIVDRLIEHGADPAITGQGGMTVTALARSRGDAALADHIERVARHYTMVRAMDREAIWST